LIGDGITHHPIPALYSFLPFVFNRLSLHGKLEFELHGLHELPFNRMTLEGCRNDGCSVLT
jgi:hypothetical protein